MLDNSIISVNYEYLNSILVKKETKKTKKSRFSSPNTRGIHIGFEVESKKALYKKSKVLSSKNSQEEDMSTLSPYTDKSTTVSDKSIKRLSITPEKSILGKRIAFPFMEGCNDIDNYSLLNYIHEGAYGAVYRARDNYTGKIHAIKKVKFLNEKEGFPITSLREINLLRSLNHENIINMKEVATSKNLEDIYLVMEYAEHEIRNLIQNYRYQFCMSEIKCLMKQLLKAVVYLHNQGIIHRDLKTSNLLYTEKGQLKVCDFGLSRKGTNGSYTPTVVTLNYRAPELLLGSETYTSAIDMWSVGCIFAELLLGEPFLKARGEMEQIDLIFRTMGTPTTSGWPGWKQLKFAGFFEGRNYPVNRFYEIFAGLSFGGGVYLSDDGIDLLEQMLIYDPSKRITAEEALRHPWFQETPLAKNPEEMPVFPATNDMARDVAKKKLFINNNKVVNCQ